MTRTPVGRAGRSAIGVGLVASIVLGSLVGGQARQVGLGELSEQIEQLAERVGPAVVQIMASGYVARRGQRPAGERLLSTERSSGSGVIVDSSGYIVTNAHVVAGASRLQVELAANQAATAGSRSILGARGRIIGAQLVGLDLETDLAVLKVEAGELPALPLADSDELGVGEIVLAFGSPLGLRNSATMGVVSAVARQPEPDHPMIYIQTDASINPGNSGGPLVDSRGRLVGINTFILSQSGGNEGIGFAAPSNIVRNVYEQIRRQGRVRRGEIGVSAQTLTPELAQGLGIAQDWGVVLADVYPGGPAAAAGLQVGDVVLALDGKTMENGRQFQVNLYGRTVGETVRLDVLRSANRGAYFVAVVERPDDPERFLGLVQPENHLVEDLGILGLDLTPEIARGLPQLRRQGGVLIAATVEGALPTRDEEFLPGDLIHAVNRRAVRDLASLAAALAALGPGDAIAVQVERQGRLLYVAFIKE